MLFAAIVNQFHTIFWVLLSALYKDKILILLNLQLQTPNVLYRYAKFLQIFITEKVS